jgi:hypothetical protein
MVRRFFPFPGLTDCARHLGGCLLARAPDLQNFVNVTACMKPAMFLFLFRVTNLLSV